jgi:prepilin-type N-terminal cleavage/methylation domain-containing protein
MTGQSRKGFTLAEMIAAIALLAVFSVLVVQLFAASNTLARRTDRLDGAVLCARNLVERWQSGSERSNLSATRYEVDSLKNGAPTRLYYDAKLEAVKETDAIYLAELLQNVDSPNGIDTLKVSINDSENRPLFELIASRLTVTEALP